MLKNSELFLGKMIIFFLSFFLLVDTLNGFTKLAMGLDLKLSVAYKSLILVLSLIYVVRLNIVFSIYFVFSFILFLSGETLSLFLNESNGQLAGFIIQQVIKLMTPVILFLFLADFLAKYPFCKRSVARVFNINAFVFISNILLGIAGYGFSTYGGEVREESVGVKGFFYAGNEISMLLVVFAAYYLYRVYVTRKAMYLIIAPIWLAFAAAISTKTSIIAILLLVALVPILVERKGILNPTRIPSLIFYTIVGAAIYTSYSIYIFVQESNFYERLEFIYQKQGLWGIVLSGRDEFLVDMWALFANNASAFSLLLGKGASFFEQHVKYSAELDFPDLFFWFGLYGVLHCLLITFLMSYFAIKNTNKSLTDLSLVILTTNSLLLIISNLSGHVFTSGMLSFIWPCLAVLPLCYQLGANKNGK